jgi:hypothetical protein
MVVIRGLLLSGFYVLGPEGRKDSDSNRKDKARHRPSISTVSPTQNFLKAVSVPTFGHLGNFLHAQKFRKCPNVGTDTASAYAVSKLRNVKNF